MADSLGLLRRSGVACLLGIDGRNQTVGHRRPGARASTRSSRTASSSAASTRTGRTGSRESRHSTGRGNAGPACSRLRRPARAARPLRGGVRPPRRQGDARPRRVGPDVDLRFRRRVHSAYASGTRSSRAARSARADDRVADLGRAVAVLERRAVRRDVAVRRRSPASMWCSSCTNVSPQPMMWPGGHQCSQNGWLVSVTSTVLKPARAIAVGAEDLQLVQALHVERERALRAVDLPLERVAAAEREPRRLDRADGAVLELDRGLERVVDLAPLDERLHEAGDRRDLAVQEPRRGRSRACRCRRARPSRPRRDAKRHVSSDGSSAQSWR